MTELQQKMEAAYRGNPAIGRKTLVKITGAGHGTQMRLTFTASATGTRGI